MNRIVRKDRSKKRGRRSTSQRLRRQNEKGMKQQQEAGTSSSSFPTPTDDHSTFPSTSTYESSTFPSTSTDECSTFPPTSTDDCFTFPPTSADEYSTFPKTSTDDHSTFPPTSTDEHSTFPTTSTDEYSASLQNPADEYSTGPSNIKPPYKMKESRKFVNVAFFVKSLQNLNNHGVDGCNFSDMYISGETRCGWNSGIQLSCSICLVTVTVPLTDTVWMEGPNNKPVTAQTSTPQTLTGTASVKLPVIAQKAPAKKRNPCYRKTPTPPPDPPFQQHFLVPRPLAKSITFSQSNRPQQNMAASASNQISQPFIKQEDVPSSCQGRLSSSAAQPASVQLLFYVEPSGSAQNLENDIIVPDFTPSEALPVNLNLVKKEVVEESPSMEVVTDIPRLVPMSETSLDRSKTLFASELLTNTGHFKDSSPIKMRPVTSSTKTYSKENRDKYCTVSSCPTSVNAERSFQQIMSNSKTDSASPFANLTKSDLT